TAEAGLCVVIPCSFTTGYYFSPTNVVWFKCEATKKKCVDSDIIFHTTNFNKVQTTFKGRVSLLEPDLDQRNCSIIINDLQESDSGLYQLRVNGFLNYLSNGITFPSRSAVFKPSVVIPLLTEGQQTNLTCTAPGLCSGSRPEITWTWRGNGESSSQITENITDFHTEDLTPFTQRHSSTLTFNPSSEHHGTNITCKVSFTGGITTEETVMLNVNVKEVKITGDTSVREGETLNLTCSVDSFPPSDVMWAKFGTENLFSVSISNVTLDVSGLYICTAKHGNKTLSKTVNITVNKSPSPSSGNTVHFKEGDQIVLECNVKRSNPQPDTFIWKRNGKDVGKGKTYEFNQIKPEDGGNYTCEARNSVSSGKSKSLHLQVQFPPTNVQLTLPPEVKEGQSITITCTAESFPPSNFKILRSSLSNSQSSENISTSSANERNTFTHTFDATLAHAGSYICEVSNSEGTNHSAKRKLEVKLKENESFSLNCNGQSNPPITSYTWMKKTDNKNIGRTSVYTVKSASPSDGGLYSCEAKNTIGTGRSQPVEVKIKYSPKITTVSVSPSGPFPENSQVSLTCSSDANPAVKSYTWYRADGGQETVVGTGSVLNITASTVNSVFLCTAENDLGTGRSKNHKLDVQSSEGARRSSDNKCEEDVVYSNMDWTKRSKKKKRENDVDMNQSGSSYLAEEKCLAGDAGKCFVSNALEMGGLYAECKPRNVKMEVDCEYAQVQFKKKREK
uniref:B-cell receptor CD22 n=1 Tax=Kryptolebias marmoratus TaxID=37003 RepID=A0A3Q3GU27_KRYMA